MTATTTALPLRRVTHVRRIVRRTAGISRSWRWWLGLIAISAFGPFLDVITRQPVNWLLGLSVLIFAGGVVVSQLVRPFRMRAVPYMTLTVIAWNYWYFTQLLRPDINHINALLAFRVPLVSLAAYVLTVLLAMRCRTREALQAAIVKFAGMVATVGVIVSAYSIFQWIVGYERLERWRLIEPAGFYLVPNVLNDSVVFRVFGTMRRNEALAAFLLVVEIVAISAWRLPGINRRRLLVAIVLSLGAMFLSLSLTGITIFVIWLCLMAVTKMSWRMIRVAIVLLLLAAVGGYVADDLTHGLLRMRIYGHRLDVANDQGRLQMFENWIAEMGDRSIVPLLVGSGICTGVEETSAGRIEKVLRGFGLQAEIIPCGWSREVHDNWFGTLSLEVGVVGLILVWLFYLAAAVYAIRNRQSRTPLGVFVFMTSLGIVAFWPSGFVGALTLYHPVNIYFWSMAGIIEVIRSFGH